MSEKKIHEIGIIMNGVTGRMGLNQHLRRSIWAIIKQGGVSLGPSEVIIPRPILVGRNAFKLEAISAECGGLPWSTNLDETLADSQYSIYFDSQTTDRRAPDVKKAIAAGKHIYCEKPVADTLPVAMELFEIAEKACVKHGVVQDKLWLPGLRKLQTLKDLGFFGRIFSVRGEFGYWVFEGDTVKAQRPSWNYRKEEGGGIIIDMLCHWRYVLDNLFGPVKAVSCLGATHIPTRWDESDKPYKATADDAAYATFEIDGEDGRIIAHFNSSWCVRVRRDDLLTIQVDGTKGTAVAGLRDCWVQHYGGTPKPVWNPDIANPLNFYEGWQKVPEQDSFDNAFKVQWELFLRHVVKNEPFRWGLMEAAKGVQLAEKGIESWKKRAWVDVPAL
ncbi:MAG TPA: Gfo/Idh/MocA family oxidoreductase [Candidatus Acidoferrum sp.]|nr:Gfo/Idh/MocA family oxidoreductase [Candidatus Acidoferrum sp.]